MNLNIFGLALVLVSQTTLATEKISAEKLRGSIELQVQNLIMSADGKSLIAPNLQKGSYRTQAKAAELKSIWTLNAGYGGSITSGGNLKEIKPMNLEFSLKVSDGNEMSLSITEYSKVEFKDGAFKKSGKGRSETFQLLNFESVSWSQKAADHSVVTRFVPVYVGNDDIVDLKGTPITLSNVLISDNRGKVWMEGASAIGEVARFGTKEGLLYVSFTNFKGSTEIGTAEGGTLELKLTEKLTVRIRSAQPILGNGLIAKVYGKYLPKDTSSGGSVQAMSAKSAEEKLK